MVTRIVVGEGIYTQHENTFCLWDWNMLKKGLRPKGTQPSEMSKLGEMATVDMIRVARQEVEICRCGEETMALMLSAY